MSLDDSIKTHLVKILRDAGAALTLLLESVLSLSEQTFTGRSVLIQGVELGVINVPLHRICLKSDLITGPVTVGVPPTLPVPCVSLLLGNDIAGGKVVPDPIVCEKVKSNATLDDQDDDLYPACAVTRAITRRREIVSDHSTGAKYSSTDIDLNDTFFSNIDEYKTSTEPQNIRKMVKNTPLPGFIGNDDKLNLPLKQDKRTSSAESNYLLNNIQTLISLN